MQTITYTNKSALNANNDIADINKCNASDMNEIKSVVNNNAIETESRFTNLGTYSTTEVDTGKTWIDNKTIYRKVVNFGALTTADTTKSVAHGISSLSAFTKIECIAFDSANDRWFPIPFAPVSQMYSSTSSSIRVDETNINISSSTDWSSFTAIVILEYTKS